MASEQDNWITITDLRGGRNGTTPPIALRPDECADAVNVDWYNSLFGRKRGGTTALDTSNTTFTGTVSSLARHVPTSDDTQAELWASDNADTPIVNRFAAGAWTAPALEDDPTGNGWDFSYASLDGKLFIAYKSGVDRLHVWDGTTVRRTGLTTPGSNIAVTNDGTGTYAATERFYRVRWTRQVDDVTVLRSEPSEAVSFTPSGTGGAAVIVRDTCPDQGATHWELEVSLDNATFYLLSTNIIDAETYADFADTATYSEGTLSPSTGTYNTQKSYKFLAVDQNRLLGFGSHTSTNKQNRIEISAIVGELNVGDAERVPLDSYIDLDENDSGAPTGLLGPLNGSFFAFKTEQFWKLTPTGNAANPYSRTPISKTIGCVAPRAYCVGEDEMGTPAIYFLSARGPYRWGSNGLEYIGHGVEDLLLGPTSTMNVGADIVTAHAVYHKDKRQVWFFVATGDSTEPDLLLVWNVGRAGGVGVNPVPSGWSQYTGEIARARASVMFSDSVGATMGARLKPYIAYAGAANTIWKCDTTDTTDAGTPYRAYITSRVYVPWGLQRNGEISRCYVLAKAANNVTFSQTIYADYGVQQTESSVDLSPEASETRVRRRFEDAGLSDVGSIQFIWGDDAAIANQWQIDAVAVEAIPHEVA